MLASPHLRHAPSHASLASSVASERQSTPLPASHAYRMLLLVVAGVHVLLTAGVVFGWASLASVLASEGALCGDRSCSGQTGSFGASPLHIQPQGLVAV